MVLSKSEHCNENYLAKVIKIKNIKKHPNADRLQIVTVDYQNIIVNMSFKEGDIVVFVPAEAQINKEFLSKTNSFRSTDLNVDREVIPGFFEENCRVKAIRLQKLVSFGYIIPVEKIEEIYNVKISNLLDTEFDMIKDIQFVKKYESTKNLNKLNNISGNKTIKVKTQDLESKIKEKQFKFHISTSHLGKNIGRVNPSDIISITNKVHGTSFIIANLLVKRDLKWYEKLLLKMKVGISKYQYECICSSRTRVRDISNDKMIEEKDIYRTIRNEIKDCIPKGFTLYGEAIGFDTNGAYIQNQYDYGCNEKEHKIQIYRITFTNEDGLSFELSYDQIKEFCKINNLNYVKEYFYGKATDFVDYRSFLEQDKWHEFIMKEISNKYLEKDSVDCKNKVPDEGIVLRIDGMFEFNAYKAKSSKFLEFETKDLDRIEKENSNESGDDDTSING